MFVELLSSLIWFIGLQATTNIVETLPWVVKPIIDMLYADIFSIERVDSASLPNKKLPSGSFFKPTL
jgi:hypothetical protein